ncbi:hypothetical protein C7H85_00595 [Zobellella endophytica]|uniref:TIR domain-containing protein n=1 Tax=Zobellella endophytica TaxID=2116700 RepID=A0A2P7RAX7_9GAMM|nr:toll/interleukin-1 receptor domain-containing protein [Zobellella endophytica]PSJ47371.1 hypothetical protein C7H85_00595 [Zobellella endophytica]
MTPKVFISHASEDKERFVTAFATRLRENGVDAWLDRWEMLPGDSLVDKIFEEGLKNAHAVVIVLSKNSVSKPWVSEELNASMVSRISKGTKIIPVVIDSCEVPEALKSTLWERVDELADFEKPLKRVLAAVFDVREKPPVGNPPDFIQKTVRTIEGLSNVDTLVLSRAAAYDLERNSHIVEPENIFTDLDELGLTLEQILESIEILGSDGYFDVIHYMGGGSERFGCYIQVTDYGHEKYCSSEIKDYDLLKERCAALIVNENILDNQSLVEKTGASLRLIEHILDVFESNGLIKATKHLGGKISIHHVHSKLRRVLS